LDPLPDEEAGAAADPDVDAAGAELVEPPSDEPPEDEPSFEPVPAVVLSDAEALFRLSVR
jgi:hypothetical protein